MTEHLPFEQQTNPNTEMTGKCATQVKLRGTFPVNDYLVNTGPAEKAGVSGEPPGTSTSAT